MFNSRFYLLHKHIDFLQLRDYSLSNYDSYFNLRRGRFFKIWNKEIMPSRHEL